MWINDMYTDMWEIIDDNGLIHSGTEQEMSDAFRCMISPSDFSSVDVDKWYTDWSGDLKLIQIHEIFR